MSKTYSKKPKWKLRAVICIVLYFVTNLLLSFFPFSIMTYMIVWYAITVPISIALFKDELKEAFAKTKSNWKSYIKLVIKYLLITYGINILVGMVVASFTDLATSENQAAIEELPIIFTAILSIGFAPILEELVFRGSIRKLVKPKWLFVVISGLFFGAIHIISEIATLDLELIIATGLPYFIPGACFAYYYTKTDNILVNVGVHALQNTIGVLMMLVM